MTDGAPHAIPDGCQAETGTGSLAAIRAGVRMREDGDVVGAREQLSALWPSLRQGDPFVRLFLAHSLADVQEDPQEELRWDVLAMATYDEVTPERAREQGIPGGKAGLLPSLYLNLAHDYARLDRFDEAIQHYQLAVENIGALGDDAYGDQLRQAYATFRADYPALF